jgi:hypothetical protein
MSLAFVINCGLLPLVENTPEMCFVEIRKNKPVSSIALKRNTLQKFILSQEINGLDL